MRTAAYKVDVASDRRRRKNVPRHILCYAHIERSQPNELCCDHHVIPQKDIMLLRRMTIV